MNAGIETVVTFSDEFLSRTGQFLLNSMKFPAPCTLGQSLAKRRNDMQHISLQKITYSALMILAVINSFSGMKSLNAQATAESKLLSNAKQVDDFKAPKSNLLGDDLKILSQQLVPVIDESMVAIAHVDLNRFSDEFIRQKLESLLPNNQDLLGESVELTNNLLALRKTVLNAGGRHVFVTASLIDIADLPIVISVPGIDKQKASQLVAMNEQQGWVGPEPFVLDNGLVVICHPNVRRRLEAGTSFLREDLATIDAKLSDFGSFHIVPTLDHLRVVRELMPELDKSFGGMNGDDIADGVESVSLNIKSVDPFEVTVEIRSKNEAAAEKTLRLLMQLRKKLGGNDAKGLMLKGLMAQLKVEQKGASLRLRLGEEEERQWLAIRPFFDSAVSHGSQYSKTNALRRILLGLHNLHDTCGSFPDLGLPKTDETSSGLSWRVHLLPFIEQAELYKRFRLDEDWDSDHNKKLIALIPKLYLPDDNSVERGKTLFVMPRGKKFFANPFPTMPDDGKPRPLGRRMRDILDGTSNTIAIVSVTKENAVIWTKPEDWQPNEKSPFDGIIDKGTKSITFALVDGSVRTILLRELTNEKFLAWLTIAGGEIIDD